MANEQNLVHFDSETAKLAQPKSVEKRYENKIRNGLIREAIMRELTEDDLREIARGAIERAKEDSQSFRDVRDTVDGKLTDHIEADVNGFEIRVHNVE